MKSPNTPVNDPPNTRVLIVDDEAPIAETLAMVVAEAGFQADIACHGAEALERAHAVWPALVITDLMMPYLDGAGLIAALRQEAANDAHLSTPIIVMTASSSALAQATGADAVLRKPFDLNEVEALIRRFLSK